MIPKVVSRIGDICIENFHKNKIGTIMKHIPGHGLAKVDSHKLTPSNLTKSQILCQKRTLYHLRTRDVFLR